MFWLRNGDSRMARAAPIPHRNGTEQQSCSWISSIDWDTLWGTSSRKMSVLVDTEFEIRLRATGRLVARQINLNLARQLGCLIEWQVFDMDYRRSLAVRPASTIDGLRHISPLATNRPNGFQKGSAFPILNPRGHVKATYLQRFARASARC